MKSTSLVLSFILILSAGFTQPITLSNNLLLKDNIKIGRFEKVVKPAEPFAGIQVFSLAGVNIITAVVKKMEAPVRELKPFYYYDIMFPGLNDSFSVYYDEEAFSIHLAKIIGDYELIIHDTLNTEGVILFKKNYSQQRLSDKIDDMRNFLNDSRNFQYQVERDRTKKVIIINERAIMQDSVIVGYFNIADVPVNLDRIAAQNPLQRTESMINPLQNIEVKLPDNHIVEQRYMNEYYNSMRRKDIGYELFQKSRPPKMNMTNRYIQLLSLACSLIENYAL